MICLKITHIYQTFLHATDSTQQQDQELSKSIKAILFLGTPHKGSGAADIGEFVRSVVSAIGADTAKQNLKALQIDNNSLQECHKRFLQLLKRRIQNDQTQVDISIFQEARGLTGVSYLGLNQKVVSFFENSRLIAIILHSMGYRWCQTSHPRLMA